MVTIHLFNDNEHTNWSGSDLLHGFFQEYVFGLELPM